MNVEARKDASNAQYKTLFLPSIATPPEKQFISCSRLHFFLAVIARLRHGPGPLFRPALEPGRARRVRREVECELREEKKGEREEERGRERQKGRSSETRPGPRAKKKLDLITTASHLQPTNQTTKNRPRASPSPSSAPLASSGDTSATPLPGPATASSSRSAATTSRSST